jgi:hypothetical protein
MIEVISPVKAVYAHGDTVTVSIIRDSDEQSMVSGAACSELGSTGIFQYQPVFTPPISKTTYTVIFSNTIYSQTAELVLGGYDYQASQLPAAPNVAAIDSQLSGTHGASTWGQAGLGSSTYTDTVLDPNANPIEGVQIEAYSDNDRQTLVDVQETDINGVFIMYLNPGTYYCRAIKAGYSFDDWEKIIT